MDKSLLTVSHTAGEPRFGMLETIREYAWERLAERGETDALQQAHARFFTELAEASKPHMYSARETDWVKRLEADHDNLRAALLWSIEDNIELGLRLAGSLGRFWHLHAHHSEGRRWLLNILAKSEDNSAALNPLRARAFDQAGVLSYFMGDAAQAYALAEQSVQLWRKGSDSAGLAEALCDFGAASHARDDLSQARLLLEESVALFRQLEDKSGLVRSLFWHGHITYRLGDYETARASAEESISLAQEIGDISSVGAVTTSLGRIAFRQGDLAAAQSYFKESWTLFQASEDRPGVAIALDWLGGLAYLLGDYGEARTHFEQSLAIWQELGSRPDVAWLWVSLGYLDLLDTKSREATQHFTQSLNLYRELLNEPGIAACLAGFAGVAHTNNQLARSARLMGATEALLAANDAQLGDPWKGLKFYRAG